MRTIFYYALLVLCFPLDLTLRFLARRYKYFHWFVTHAPENLFWIWGQLYLYRCYFHAERRVPAFAEFQGFHRLGDVANWTSLLETDKENYIKAFSTEDRCLDGRIPFRNTLVDESSGSSGQAYNWVRSLDERQVSHMLVSHFVRYNLETTDLFTINAFSMGSWATGLNMGLAMQENGLVKNVGPDIDKILSTLEFWGPKYKYGICGYPPFLKHLLDTARERNFPIGDYTLFGLVGGEGMSEGLRDYLQRDFKIVFSGYGATDLEIGISGETPISIAIRRAARGSESLRKELFGDDPRLPMVFQFNPVSHFFEVNAQSELVITIPRLNMLSPRIRYNIHDKGGVMRFNDMLQVCKKHGVDLAQLLPEGTQNPHLPFCWVFGRSDYTVSVMGANIYPEDIEQCLYAVDELSVITHSFCLGTAEENGNVRPVFSFEIRGEITAEQERTFSTKIPDELMKFNADFKEAWSEHPETLVPIIQLYNIGEGPFASDSGTIKQVRIL